MRVSNYSTRHPKAISASDFMADEEYTKKDIRTQFL